jgi:hypothetical protein
MQERPTHGPRGNGAFRETREETILWHFFFCSETDLEMKMHFPSSHEQAAKPLNVEM